jgi:hypothetical protein
MRKVIQDRGGPFIWRRTRLGSTEGEASSAPASVFSWVSDSVEDSFIAILARLTTRSICSVRTICIAIIRWASWFSTEKRIEVCALVQNALLIGGPVDEIEDVVAATAGAMAPACDLVLDGFRLHAKPLILKFQERYSDERGVAMLGPGDAVVGGNRSAWGRRSHAQRPGDGGVKNREAARLNLQVGVEMPEDVRRAMRCGWGMTHRGDGSTVLCRTHPG